MVWVVYADFAEIFGSTVLIVPIMRTALHITRFDVSEGEGFKRLVSLVYQIGSSYRLCDRLFVCEYLTSSAISWSREDGSVEIVNRIMFHIINTALFMPVTPSTEFVSMKTCVASSNTIELV